MKLFRKILFWSHLVAGVIAGLFIGIMCFTGTLLSFEHEIVEWAERDARQVTVPADAARLPLADLQRNLREAQPEFRATGVILLNDPAAAVAFTAGRDGGFYANPYTGEIKQPASTKVHDFMHLMTDWHRVLGRQGDQRPIGKLINGVCNIAFFALAVTGLYLWMPRTWSWRGVKAVALFNRKASGIARDFNWHNVIGLWTAPILIVLTLTAIPISFRWGGDLIYQLTGEEPPPRPVPGQTGPAAATMPAFDIKRPTPDARPLAHDALLATVQQDFPRWEQITLRTGGPAQRAQRPAGTNTATSAREASTAGASAPSIARPSSESAPAQIQNPAAERSDSSPARIENPSAPSRPAAQPVTIAIRETDSWPRTATTTLTINPFTGEVLKREGYADLSAARQIRSWTRYLHTGQALGWPGQLVAGLACLGGCFLVYTGFALSFRRFFKRGRPGSTISRSKALEKTSATAEPVA